MKCTVCQHPDLHAIDRALLSGRTPLRALGRQYQLSKSALSRHKNLLLHQMAQAEARYQQQQQQEALVIFNELLEITRSAARTAAAAGDTRQAIQAARESSRLLNFINKMDVKLDRDAVYRLLTDPHYLARTSLLPTDPRFVTDSRQALAGHLSAPAWRLPPDSVTTPTARQKNLRSA